MKIKFAFCALLFMVSISSFSQNTDTLNLKELRLKQIENIKNPDQWDMDRMKKIDINPISDQLPIRFGAFPVPHYKNIGPYRGGGVVNNFMARSLEEYRLMVKDKEVTFSSFHIGNSPFYKKEDRNKVFFTVVTVVDTVSANNFILGAGKFISRNHPDYGGEGSIITKKDKVDFVSFTTPDKGSFAIVNMRLFHLEFGNIILVAPQKDGSFRSLQLKGKSVTNEEIMEYLKNTVLKQENVIKFLTEDGVI